MKGRGAAWVTPSTVTLHGSSEVRTGPWRRTVDLIGKNDRGEDRTRTEVPLVVLLVVDIHARNISREQWGELNESASSCCHDRAGEWSFPVPGAFFQEEGNPWRTYSWEPATVGSCPAFGRYRRPNRRRFSAKRWALQPALSKRRTKTEGYTKPWTRSAVGGELLNTPPSN